MVAENDATVAEVSQMLLEVYFTQGGKRLSRRMCTMTEGQGGGVEESNTYDYFISSFIFF